MGNMEEKQAQMREKLKAIIIQESGEGITITANAAREITNISIDDEYATAERKEELEDLLIVLINNLLKKVGEEEAKESQSMIKDMLPPGMSGMFGV